MNNALHYIQHRQDAPAQAVPLILPEKRTDKAALLEALAQACHFPAYFGNNWDSMWDCLTECRTEHLLLTVTDKTVQDTQDWQIFTGLIEDACRLRGKPQLWLLLPVQQPD